MRPLDRLAVRVRERGWRGQRDALRVAEELCWDFPYGLTFAEFNVALAPFVDGLDVAQTGVVKASIWCALPDEMREPAWQQLADEINADPKSHPRPAVDEDELEAAA